ncbi:uncharacterized protein LOC128546626 isoform X2 [Mercenaria mercenaria]|uniref:uncharacterized protein LOC128546626 isoform X2 n=1 Tax=Mercenaria mercenaria TaxID=6596 RepID=UPI00234FA113|nr:uncharacterized protein LOC128546626 isoform X2 [Mercenaria mercenaria]
MYKVKGQRHSTVSRAVQEPSLITTRKKVYAKSSVKDLEKRQRTELKSAGDSEDEDGSIRKSKSPKYASSANDTELILYTKQIHRYEIGNQGKGLFNSGGSDGKDGTGLLMSWKQCISEPNMKKSANIAENLIQSDKMLEAEFLNDIYKKFKSNPALLKTIFQMTSKQFENINGVVETKFGYRLGDQEIPTFVCFVTNRDLETPSALKGLTAEYRYIKACNEEETTIHDKERRNRMDFEDKSSDIYTTIRDQTEKLRKNHSNLIGISASHYKSKHFKGKGKHIFEEKPCIVFYVKGKGVIPFAEKLLPKRLGRFETDVRDAYYVRKVGGEASKLHHDVKIGCQIRTNSGSGTIGGFVERQGEIMAITCAHVILKKRQLKDLSENPRFNLPDIECFQSPNKSKTIDVIGTLADAKYNELVDVAFVKVVRPRLPTKGVFPDVKNTVECQSPCTHCYGIANRLCYNTGEVLRPEDVTKDSVIVKYGAASGFTRGRISQISTFTEFTGNDKMIEQIEVVSDDIIPFSEAGDSGSLVFSVDENKEMKAIGILVGGTESKDFVTPITEVFKSFESL